MAEAKAPKKTTEYAVFRMEMGKWHPVGGASDYSAKAAIVAVADEPGDYYAVPQSNITHQAMGYPPPEKPKLQPVEQLTIEQVEVGEDGFPKGPSSLDAKREEKAVAAGEDDGA